MTKYIELKGDDVLREGDVVTYNNLEFSGTSTSYPVVERFAGQLVDQYIQNTRGVNRRFFRPTPSFMVVEMDDGRSGSQMRSEDGKDWNWSKIPKKYILDGFPTNGFVADTLAREGYILLPDRHDKPDPVLEAWRKHIGYPEAKSPCCNFRAGFEAAMKGGSDE